jgi:hypothetical protein
LGVRELLIIFHLAFFIFHLPLSERSKIEPVKTIVTKEGLFLIEFLLLNSIPLKMENGK